MRRWIAAIVVGCALTALWRLPPDALPSVEPREPTEFDRRRAELTRLNGEAQTTAESLLRYQWSDSLAALVVSRARDGVAVAVPERAALDGDIVRKLADLVRDDVEAADPLPDAPLLGYVYQPLDHGRTGDRPFSRTPRTEVYAGTVDGRPYCIQLRVVEPGRVRASIESRLDETAFIAEPASTVASCRPYLRHGLPGAAVEAWLEAGALALADRAGEPMRSATPWPRRRRPFGINVFALSSATFDVDRCMTGQADACTRLILDPGLAREWRSRDGSVVRESPAASLGGTSPFRIWLPNHDFYLHDLEAEFGRQAFRRFWTSDRPVDEAFASAFGVEVGAWTVEWLDRTVGLDGSGPELPRSASTGALLTVALLLAGAWATHRRRRVA